MLLKKLMAISKEIQSQYMLNDCEIYFSFVMMIYNIMVYNIQVLPSGHSQ